MKTIKYFLIALLFISISCISSKTIADENNIKIDVINITTNGDQYLINYSIQFDNDIDTYSIYYFYKPSVREWHYAYAFYRTVDKDYIEVLKGNNTILETFVINYKIPVKVRIIAFTENGDIYFQKDKILWEPS